MSERPTLSVKNFEQFQHYKDRKPVWIKLYNDLLDDYEFGQLPDASKWHLIAIWLLASRSNNCIPYDAKWISSRINARSKIDLEVLIDSGFIVVNQPLQSMEQDASNSLALARSREEETETEKDYAPNGAFVSANGADPSKSHPVQEAFDLYNQVAQELGLPHAEILSPERKRHLKARLKDHGIDGWKRALMNLGESSCLLGVNDRGWRADLNFLLRPEKFNRLIEGGYLDRTPERQEP